MNVLGGRWGDTQVLTAGAVPAVHVSLGHPLATASLLEPKLQQGIRLQLFILFHKDAIYIRKADSFLL